jgi:hypothetical protein
MITHFLRHRAVASLAADIIEEVLLSCVATRATAFVQPFREFGSARLNQIIIGDLEKTTRPLLLFCY